MNIWVFDLDGTLVDSLTSHFCVLRKVFKDCGQEFTAIDEQEVLKVTANTLPEYFTAKLGSANTANALAKFKELNLTAFNDIKAFEGIENLLQTLKNQGRELAVWTARDSEAAKMILKSTGLESYFSICVSGTCVTNNKPHPEGLYKIADHFKSSKEKMIMVGDFDSDMLGAQAFGCVGLRVNWHHAVPQPNCQIAKKQFSKVSEMLQWIQAYGNEGKF